MAVMGCPSCGVRVNVKAPRCQSCGVEIWSEKETAARPRHKLGLWGWLVMGVCTGIVVNLLVMMTMAFGAGSDLWVSAFNSFVGWQFMVMASALAVIVFVNIAARLRGAQGRWRLSWVSVVMCIVALGLALASFAKLDGALNAAQDSLLIGTRPDVLDLYWA